MYFECRNKQFVERKKQGWPQAGRRDRKIIKRIKVNFISQWRVSAVVSEFVKQVFKKQWPYHNELTLVKLEKKHD